MLPAEGKLTMKESNHEQYDLELKSPMGWIKVKGDLFMDTETEFHGEATLMGLTVPLTDCSRNGSVYQFKASPRLPFGVLEVTILAVIHEDGTVTGTANAPHHRPMEIKGQRVGE